MLLSLLSAAHAGTLTAAEVARHDVPEDCWLIIDDVVYDVTGFIGSHPGSEAILRGCGKDASWFFANRDDAGGHTAGARELLGSFRIGALGDEVAATTLPPVLHPFSVTADGRRIGLLNSTHVAPRKSIDLGVIHRISTVDGEPARIGFDLGYGLGSFDIHLWDATGEDVSGLEVKARPLNQHGEKAHPLSLAIQAGAGFFRDDGPPGFFSQLTAERTLMDRRLSLRGTGIATMREGIDVAAGGGIEFRPIPIHGLFAEVLVPVTADAPLAWSAGARLYTRGHHFTLYAASTPTTAVPLLTAPVDAFSIGFGFERAFRL